MKVILIAFTFLTFLSTSESFAQAVDCEERNGAIVCIDNYDYAYVFRSGYNTVVANVTTGEYVVLGTSLTGNFYTENPQQTNNKKPNFLERFGRALEQGFSQDRRRPRDSYLEDDYDPLCVTQLQRRVNKCDD